jgi:hypothetical protein
MRKKKDDRVGMAMVPHNRRDRSDAALLGDSGVSSRYKPTNTRHQKKRNLLMKKHLPTTLQAIGTIMVAMSLSMITIPLGLGFAGVALVAFGIAAERS